MIKVLNEEADNDKYRNVIESQIGGHEGTIKCFKHSKLYCFGFKAEVQDEIITNTKYIT